MRAIGLSVADNPRAKKVGKVFQFAIQDPDEVWTLDLPNQQMAPGETAKPDCTFHMKAADFTAMVKGEADAMTLYTGGKLKIKGDVMASQSLGPILKKVDEKLVAKAMAERPAEGAAAAKPKAATRSAFSKQLVAALEGKLVKNGHGSQVLQFRITDPDAAFAVDWGASPPALKPGDHEGATATLTLDDESLEALVKDPDSARRLYQRGKLRVDGDLAAARDLTFLSNGIA